MSATGPSPTAMIGRYRTEALLGQGGMGQVFRAWDEVLERRVALKVLRAGAATPEATAQTTRRILREARMVAALEHPNVVAIHDVGEHEGAPYIVMEYVRGAALRAHVGADTPPATRVAWLVDVARALSAAHRAGLVHRDVKPENVMVREDGVVKVLDFGIARRTAAEAPAAAPALLSAPAGVAALDTMGGTVEEGRFVGTPAYMAPEQLRIGEIDARADQFGWGVVAYELLTGALPWKSGTEVAAILRDVLMSDPPPLDAAALGVPPAFADAVHRALSKAPEERFSSMDALLAAVGAAPGEAAAVSGAVALTPSGRVPSGPVRVITGNSASGDDVTLQMPAEAAQLAATAPSVPRSTVAAALAPPAAIEPPRPPRSRRLGTFAIGGLAAVIAGTAAIALGFRHTASPPTAPTASASASASPPPPAGPAFAPRNVRRLTFQRGCEELPAVTPDGREVIFDATAERDTHLHALDLATNRQRQLTDERGWQWAASVSPDGKRVAYVRQQDGQSATYVVPIEGGPPRRVADGGLRPTFTPDGRAVWTGTRVAAVRVDVESGAVTRTLDPPPGHEFLTARELDDGRVVARFWDHDLTLVKGIAIYEPGAAKPRMVTEDTLVDASALSPDGRWVISARTMREEGVELVAYPASGGPAFPLAAKGITPAAGLAFSPRGDRMLWSTCRSRSNVGALARRAGKLVLAAPNSTPSDWLDRNPAWVPGSPRVVLVSTRSGTARLWVLDRSDREPPRQLATGDGATDAPAVSPDGLSVVFARIGDGLHVVPLAGDALPRRLTSGADDISPTFSRDGRTVYFQSKSPNGRPRIDAVPFDGGPARIVRERASRPTASPIADRLAFIALGDTGEAGLPTVLDLATAREQPLSPHIARGLHPIIRFSSDGRRASVFDGWTALVEIDASSGKLLGRFDAGNEDITGLTYTGDDIVVTHRMWSGNLWIADDPFR